MRRWIYLIWCRRPRILDMLLSYATIKSKLDCSILTICTDWSSAAIASAPWARSREQSEARRDVPHCNPRGSHRRTLQDMLVPSPCVPTVLPSNRGRGQEANKKGICDNDNHSTKSIMGNFSRCVGKSIHAETGRLTIDECNRQKNFSILSLPIGILVCACDLLAYQQIIAIGSMYHNLTFFFSNANPSLIDPGNAVWHHRTWWRLLYWIKSIRLTTFTWKLKFHYNWHFPRRQIFPNFSPMLPASNFDFVRDKKSLEELRNKWYCLKKALAWSLRWNRQWFSWNEIDNICLLCYRKLYMN